MNTTEKNKISAMLIELAIGNVRTELDYHMNEKHKEEALRLIEVDDAINTILDALDDGLI